MIFRFTNNNKAAHYSNERHQLLYVNMFFIAVRKYEVKIFNEQLFFVFVGKKQILNSELYV